jgi:chemotaxis protein MotB
MDDKHPEIIIIKRHSSHEEEHHGGAWKIAFADFMTAMMAFFLVLWIINATDKNTKTVIARYFNPLKLEDMAKARKGIRLPNGDDTRETKPNAEGAPQTPQDSGKSSIESDKKEPAPENGGDTNKAPPDPAHPKAQLSESALLHDPYGSLDQIAGKASAQNSTKVDVAVADDIAGAPGALDLDAFVDPFKPLAHGPAPDPAEGPKADAAPQPAQSASNAPPHPDAAVAPQKQEPPTAEAQSRSELNAKPPVPAPAPSGASPSIPERSPVAGSPVAASSDAAQLQAELVKELRGEIHAQPGPGVEVQETPEGILISLTDQFNFGMFAVGSAEPQAKVVRIMEKIAQSLKSRPGAIVVRGHTDNRQYKGANYDNWRLSSARAQMAYYMLTRGGLDEKRVERIEGYADRRLKTPERPDAAENRRIEILLRKEKS